MGAVGGVVTGVLVLSLLDLALGAGSQQVAGLAAAPANWLAKFVDPTVPGVADYRIPTGQVGKAGQLLQQLIPQALAQSGAGAGSAGIPPPSSIPPATQPATLNA